MLHFRSSSNMIETLKLSILNVSALNYMSVFCNRGVHIRLQVIDVTKMLCVILTYRELLQFWRK